MKRDSPSPLASVTLAIKVTPRAKRNEVQGVVGNALRIRLRAPPVDGEANRALREFLAGALSVPPSAVEILHGAAGRHKLVRIAGTTAAHVEMALGVALPAAGARA